MHPILFEIRGFPVYTYGLLLAAAYLLGLQFALMRSKTRGLDQNRVMDLGIWIIVSALVGAKLMLIVVEGEQFGWTATDLMNLFRSAGVFYGGLISAVVVALWYLWRHRMPVWTMTDVFAPGIALGHVIGRVGCLLAGCCFGRQTNVPWAITFHNEFASRNVGTPLDVPLHPTQLYEAGAELLILGLLLGRRRGETRTRDGRSGATCSCTGLALHHRVLPRRFARPRPALRQRPLDVAVRVAAHRPAEPRHARLSRTMDNPDTRRCSGQKGARRVESRSPHGTVRCRTNVWSSTPITTGPASTAS